MDKLVHIRLGETHDTLIQITKENAIPPLYTVFILAFLSDLSKSDEWVPWHPQLMVLTKSFLKRPARKLTKHKKHLVFFLSKMSINQMTLIKWL